MLKNFNFKNDLNKIVIRHYRGNKTILPEENLIYTKF